MNDAKAQQVQGLVDGIDGKSAVKDFENTNEVFSLLKSCDRERLAAINKRKKLLLMSQELSAKQTELSILKATIEAIEGKLQDEREEIQFVANIAEARKIDVSVLTKLVNASFIKLRKFWPDQQFHVYSERVNEDTGRVWNSEYKVSLQAQPIFLDMFSRSGAEDEARRLQLFETQDDGITVSVELAD